MAFIDPRRLLRTPGTFPGEEGSITPLSRPTRPVDAPMGSPSLARSPLDPPALPESRPPMAPLPRPDLERPAAMMKPSPLRITDYRGRGINNELDFERNQFMRRGAKVDEQGNITGFKRSMKDTLLGAGLGALQGLGSGGGLGGAIGGALGGAAVPLISPRMGREGIFEATQAPGIRQDIAERAKQQALQRQGTMDALKQRETEANIERTRAQTQQALRPPVNRPTSVAPGGTLVDPTTGQIIFTAPQPLQRPIPVSPGTTLLDPKTNQPLYTAPDREKQPTAAELDIDPDSGQSGVEMGMASYDNRGGDNYVIDRLPRQIQEIYRTGKITEADGTTRDADMNEIMQAQRAVETAVGKQKALDERYSKAHIRSKVTSGRKGTAPSSPAPLSKPSAKPSAKAAQPSSRPRSSFNSSKFPGLRFD